MGKLGVAPDGGQKTKGHSAFGAMAPQLADKIGVILLDWICVC